MRITARIVSSGERWSVDFPKIDLDKCLPWIDTKRVAQWIAKINLWKDENEIGKEAEGYGKSISRLARKAEEKRITYARANFTVSKRIVPGKQYVRQDVRCEIETRNDGVVQKRQWEELFAQLMSEAAYVTSAELSECGYPAIIFGDNAKRLYHDLIEWRKGEKREKKLKRINERRPICIHHRNGYCSPRLSFCPCYKNGKCVNCLEEK